MTSPDLSALAAEAYVYGYPLVYNLSEMQRISRDGLGSLAATPFNEFGHAPHLAGPDDDFVSVNNDTLYAIAMLDLSGGPLLLHVPDTAGRYYVLQFVDAWTNNFAYVGRRATGTAEGTYLIAPQSWTGDVPAGTTLIEAPTDVAAIVGRIACSGLDDVAAVHALQPQFTLTPLDPAGTPAGIPAPSAGVAEDLLFWERLRLWLRTFPPGAEDIDHQERFAPLGLLDAENPFASPSDELRAALLEGESTATATIEGLMKQGSAPVNGWVTWLHLFDYNLDHFSIGAIDAPEWKLEDRDASYPTRALAARAGLWGNHAYEAVYAQVWIDADGEALDGTNTYTWKLDQEPPVDAFWSLTMYNVPKFYLDANAIERYSIGDRTPGLVRDSDGSLTITISHEEPSEPTARANWLPAPAGAFRPIVRYYQPQPAILDGSYTPPAIVKNA